MSTLKTEGPGDKFLFSIPRVHIYWALVLVTAVAMTGAVKIELVSALLRVFGLGLAVAVLAIVISKSLLFAPAVDKIDRWWAKVGYACKCTMCCAGWMILAINLRYAPEFFVKTIYVETIAFGFNVFWPVNYLLGSLASWTISLVFYLFIWEFLEKNAPKMRTNLFVRKR